MDKEKIKLIIKNHKKWVLDQEGGERADLEGADLEGADLRGANLEGADLKGAYLQGAELEILRIEGSRFYIAVLNEDMVKIGCKTLRFQDFIDKKERLYKFHNFTDFEIKEYNRYEKIIELWLNEVENEANK